MRETRIATVIYDIDPELDQPPDWDYVFEGRSGINGPKVISSTDRKVEE